MSNPTDPTEAISQVPTGYETAETAVFPATANTAGSATSGEDASASAHTMAGAQPGSGTSASNGQSTLQNRPQRRQVRAGTVIWGLILMLAGVVLGLLATGRSIDVELVTIIGLAVAGVVLLGSAISKALKK